MGQLIKANLTSHIYPEILEEITRGDDALVTRAINMGEAEVRSYLNRYDLATMFVTGYTNEFLRSLCTDVVCWHLIKLSNPSINIELFRTAYEDAVKYLDKIQKGNVDPEWPLKADNADTLNDEAGHIFSVSNTKRNNHY